MIDHQTDSLLVAHSGSGTFVTGDNEGYVISWNAKSRRRLFEVSNLTNMTCSLVILSNLCVLFKKKLPRYSNSIASLAFNHTGELLAITSSHTYQEAKEK